MNNVADITTVIVEEVNSFTAQASSISKNFPGG